MGCTSKNTMLDLKSSFYCVHTVYRCVERVCSVSFQSFTWFLLIPFYICLQMSVSLETFIGYVDGASHITRNLSFPMWAIFAPNGELVTLQVICIGRSTKNNIGYITLIELLSNVISHGIHRLVIKLDSQLTVL